MKDQNFTATFLVDQTPAEVFNAVNNVRGWWSEGVEGRTEKLDDEFSYQHKQYHFSKQKLIEVVPYTKVVWLVTYSSLSFIENKSEWTDTKIIFEMAKKDNKTELRFTHLGLTPEVECYESCLGGWNHYLSSLLSFITTGKGQPDKKEDKVKVKV